ncbi:MAG TPA: FAA hydrolase family protein [Candidatus Thioglobus sp.]|jgi:2-keto-4-pentenoate hydratase/2-oxohepta-3-ene-1,7-dioic acid hydratase in catechol pathway|nr:FAA hydrolase family protein [Candidatus Thioglobus sp.]HIL21421.1 FAA hydrolase family protein [Candidatus Thioglobus sp.]
MKLATYRIKIDEQARLGYIDDNTVIDVNLLAEIAGEYLPATMQSFIDAGISAKTRLGELIKQYQGNWPAGTTAAVSDAHFLAPIPRPQKNIFGIGLNYTEHVAESARSLDTSAELPQEPVIFTKPPTTVTSWNSPIVHRDSLTQQLDWEVELAVIIGSGGSSIPKEDALNHVFGYTIINDVSARDCRRAGQWIVSKGQDSFAPMGPIIVTADEVKDPHNLNLWLKKNGEMKQNSNTKFMLFKIPELIADISSGMRLEPGDIIATGTPSGVGAGHDPQEWMWPGDIIEAGIEGIGTIRNPVIKG